MLFAAGAALALPSLARADNPVVQTLYTADPFPMVHNGTVYLFTDHDEDATVNNFFTMNDWRVYTTTDMVNWTDHGSPLKFTDFSWSSGEAWAGQVIYRNGKFYFYVPINSRNLASRDGDGGVITRKVIGVAVADNPFGPFKDALGKPLIVATEGDIDPTVYIDDDGQAYLYWGNPDLLYVKLNEDMISYQGDVVHVPMTTASFGARVGNAKRPTFYEEGPWFYKRSGLYYLVFASDCCANEKIDYSTSPSATGPWTYRGRIMDSVGSYSFTNHPAVVDYKGKSYFFYHNGALPQGSGWRRSVCVEEFTYNSDGTIPTIKMTATGPAAVATLNPFQQVEAETIAFSSGLKTETCSDAGGGMNVTSIHNGDYIKVKNVDFLDGVTSFDARVSASTSNAKIELRLDGQTGTLLGTCDVSSASAWTTKTCAVSGGRGKHDLFLKFVGGSAELFKFNWWRFTGPRMPDVGAGGTTGEIGDAGVAIDGAGGTDGSTKTGGAAGTASGGQAGTGGAVGGAGAAGAGAGGGNGGGVAGAVASGGRAVDGGGGGNSGGAAGSSTHSGGTAGTGTSRPSVSSGCSCQLANRGETGAAALVLLSLVAILRRRKQR